MKIWEMSIWIQMGFWFSWMEISKGKAFEKIDGGEKIRDSQMCKSRMV